MATHSSIPVCEFHAQRSLVGKQSMGSLISEQKPSGDFSGGPVVKNPPCNAGDSGSIPTQGTKTPLASVQLLSP